MTTPPPDDAPTPVCPPTKWARGLTAAHAALADTQPPTSSDPAETMRAAAVRLRDPYRCNSDPRADRTLADWLDAAARDAEEIGPDYRAERVAAAVLGVPAHPRVCPPGKHRPDDDPTPGDRCKDCGNDLTWRGPGPNDWDVADPLTGAEREELAEAFADYRSRTGGHVDPQDDEPEREPTPDAAAVLREKRDAAAEVTRYWIGTCPKDGVHIGIKTEGSDPDVPLVMRARDSIDSTCLCGTALTLRLVTRAEYEDVLGPDDDDEDEPDDEPDDGGPFRPRWPLLVSEDTKRTLLVQLAEVVHAPEPTGSDPRAAADWGTFRRGVEYGMAKVMLALGINEAGSPERASLPAPPPARPVCKHGVSVDDAFHAERCER